MMKFMKEERGSVAVFLLICLLPMLMFEGLVMDGIRLLACKGNMADAGELALNGALAGYNRDLKDAYGLYAVTDLQRVRKDASTYFHRTVDPQGAGVNGTEETISFLGMTAKVEAGGQAGSELSETDVLQTQIYHQMHYFTSTSGDEMKYIYDGTEYVYGAYMLIREKCLFDQELARLAEDTERSVDTLETRYNTWKQNLMLAEISGDMRKCMEGELKTAKGLLDKAKKYCTKRKQELEARADSENAAGDTAGDATEDTVGDAAGDTGEETAEENAEDTSQEDNQRSDESEQKEKELRALFSYGDMEHTSFSNFEECYTEIDVGSTPPWTEKILDADGTFDEMMDDCLSSLSTQAIRYGNGYARGVKSLVEFGGTMEECTALYASTMFSCYISPSRSLTGNDHFRDGGVMSKNAYSEIEYILCGGSDPNKNLQYCMRGLQGYLTMWCMVENYMTDTSISETSLSDAETLADGDAMKVPFYRDLFRMAYAVKSGWEKLNQMLSSEDGFSCQVYQGAECREMDYQMFLQLLLFRDMHTNYPVYLKRIRAVIEMNMQYAGYKDFSFDHAYTMLWIDAEVQVPTLLLPKQTWHYKNIAALE